MATQGDISYSLAIWAGQSVRRNAGDTAFEAYTPASGGSIACCSVYSSSNFIPSTTFSAVPFNSERVDTSNFHDNVTNNHLFTVPSAWNYRIEFNATFLNQWAAFSVRAKIVKNWTTDLNDISWYDSRTFSWVPFSLPWCSIIDSASVWDTYQVQITEWWTPGPYIPWGTIYSNFSIMKLS